MSRATEPSELATIAAQASHVPLEISQNTKEGLNLALQLATPHDLICFTGSLSVAAEAIRLLSAK